MSVTYTDIQELSPEFASLTQDRIDPFIVRAQNRINADYWGDLYDDGVLYLAAHLLSKAEAGSSAGAGAVTNYTAGPLSISYAAPGNTSSAYGGTSYGATYHELLSSLRFKAPRAI